MWVRVPQIAQRWVFVLPSSDGDRSQSADGTAGGHVLLYGYELCLEGIGIPATHQLKDGIAFTVLVLILIFRPSGILGERLSKRA